MSLDLKLVIAKAMAPDFFNDDDPVCDPSASPCAVSPDQLTALMVAENVQNALFEHLNTPELEDFANGVIVEAMHQSRRWPDGHDENKSPADWFWTLGYLGQKAMHAHERGDISKLKHHLITSAALMANWHATVIAAEAANG
ncbi:MAG: hypothetical protein AAFW60_00525 [Pseudomonadota bacterium]